MPKKKKSKPKSEEEAGGNPAMFETAVEELQEIVAQMEGDKVPLDSLLKSYERGTKLLKQCQAHLGAARDRIERIAATESGDLELEPFDPDSVGSNKTVAASSTAEPDNDESTRDDDIKLF